MEDDIIKDAGERMAKTIDVMSQGFTKVRTGRAHTSLLDHVTVEYYGSEVPLNQAASVNVEDARTLQVLPFEKNMVQPIEKAIMKADLGLNPSTAGTTIRIILPPLTEERRRDLVKVLRAESEDAKVAIRNIRRDANQDFKELVNEKELSEDEARRAEQRIQDLTDKHVEKIDSLLAAKEQEVMTV